MARRGSRPFGEKVLLLGGGVCRAGMYDVCVLHILPFFLPVDIQHTNGHFSLYNNIFPYHFVTHACTGIGATAAQ